MSAILETKQARSMRCRRASPAFPTAAPHMPQDDMARPSCVFAGGMLSEFAGQPGPDRYWRSAGSLAALLPHSDRRGSASGGGSPHHRGAAKSGAALLGLLAIALLLACSVTVIRYGDACRSMQRRDWSCMQTYPRTLIAWPGPCRISCCLHRICMCRQSSELQATATHGYWGGKVPGGSGTSGRSRPADTLVMYVYSDSDPEYRRNLEFFAGFGMAADDGCDYVIVVQQVCFALGLNMHGQPSPSSIAL